MTWPVAPGSTDNESNETELTTTLTATTTATTVGTTLTEAIVERTVAGWQHQEVGGEYPRSPSRPLKEYRFSPKTIVLGSGILIIPNWGL